MNLYKRDYIKNPPTAQEMKLYEEVLRTEKEEAGNRFVGRVNHRRLYPEAVRHWQEWQARMNDGADCPISTKTTEELNLSDKN